MSLDQNQILALVKQVRGSGDQAAFASLYDEFAQRLYAFIRIKVPTKTVAEDILQEVFLRAWSGIKHLDVSNNKDLNLSAWLYKVTCNTINDYYRKKYRQPEETPLEAAQEIASEDSPAINASVGFEKDAVKQALADLPAHYKQVIELRFFKDFSVMDTARIMNKNIVTVRVWQHRAVSRLKDLFKKYNQDNE